MWIPDQWLKKVRTDYIWSQKPTKKAENTVVDINEQNLVPNENIVYEDNNDITDNINTSQSTSKNLSS